MKCCEATSFFLYTYFKPNLLLQIKTSAPVTHLSTEGTGADRKNILRAKPLEQPAAPSAITLTKILLAKTTHSHRSKQHKWKHEKKNETRKEKWIQKYNEKRVWVEREESWECKIAPPSGNRIILWADGSSLCVGWHFPVTPSRVMLCDVCDWLLPGPWEATEPRGHLLSARSILGIVYFSSACPVFLPLPCTLAISLLSFSQCPRRPSSTLCGPVVSTFDQGRMHLFSPVKQNPSLQATPVG